MWVRFYIVMMWLGRLEFVAVFALQDGCIH
jgi:hypothetical protein